MALTREFSETVKGRLERDGEFRLALLKESMESLLEGDLATGKALLRDYINATVGFGSLAAATGTQPKNLMRMFGPSGNPTAKNLMNIIAHLQRASGVSLRVRTSA